MKYVYLYLDQDQVADTQAKLQKLRFVKSTEVSMRPELATEYGPDQDTAMNRLKKAAQEEA